MSITAPRARLLALLLSPTRCTSMSDQPRAAQPSQDQTSQAQTRPDNAGRCTCRRREDEVRARIHMQAPSYAGGVRTKSELGSICSGPSDAGGLRTQSELGSKCQTTESDGSACAICDNEMGPAKETEPGFFRCAARQTNSRQPTANDQLTSQALHWTQYQSKDPRRHGALNRPQMHQKEPQGPPGHFCFV